MHPSDIQPLQELSQREIGYGQPPWELVPRAALGADVGKDCQSRLLPQVGWNGAWLWRGEETDRRSGGDARDTGYKLSTSEGPLPAGHLLRPLPTAPFLGGLFSGLLMGSSGHWA